MNTTIAISNQTRDSLREFGNKGETYDEIITKILDSAKERQLQEILMDETNTVTAKQALESARKRWQK